MSISKEIIAALLLIVATMIILLISITQSTFIDHNLVFIICLCLMIAGILVFSKKEKVEQ